MTNSSSNSQREYDDGKTQQATTANHDSDRNENVAKQKN